MNELLDTMKTLRLTEVHLSIYECSINFYAPWGSDGSTTVTLTAKTPQELTQAILRMTGGVDNV